MTNKKVYCDIKIKMLKERNASGALYMALVRVEGWPSWKLPEQLWFKEKEDVYNFLEEQERLKEREKRFEKYFI